MADHSPYEYVFENVNDAVFIHDLAGQFLEVNRAARERLGYTHQELLAMHVQELDTPEMAAHFDVGMRGLMQVGSIIVESCHRRKDGSCVPVELSVRMIEYNGQPAVLTVARDITERKRLQSEIEERSRALEASYAQAEERAQRIAALQDQIASMAIREERDRLGRELHDSLGQVLGFVGMKTAQLNNLLLNGRIEETRQGLTELNQLAEAAYRDVREAILGLRTTVSADTGLETILREYLSRYQREWQIVAELVMTGSLPRLAPTVEIQLLRIVQEALANVRKHAHATRVCVHLSAEPDRLWATIVDNGIGFDDALTRAGHFGLDTMRERAESVGGDLNVKSTPGAGTRVCVGLPYVTASEVNG